MLPSTLGARSSATQPPPMALVAVPPATRAADEAYVTNLIAQFGGNGALLQLQPEASAWIGDLDAGRSHASVARRIVQNQVIRTQLVDGLYRDLLGRSPSGTETSTALASLASRGSFRGVIARIVAGPEFASLQGDTISGLKAALARLLGGPGDSTVSTSSTTGTPPTSAALSRLATAAMGRGYVDPTLAAQFQGLTGLSPSPATLTRLTQRVDAGGGLLAVLSRLASGSTAVATLSASLPDGLSIKRVANALQIADPTATTTPVASIAYAAAPFQVTNADARRIGPANTDFWTINLDPSDSVSIRAIDPETQQVDVDVDIYVWQASTPIRDASGVPEPGTTYTLVAGPERGETDVQAPMTVAPPTDLSPADIPENPGSGGVSMVIGFVQAGRTPNDPSIATQAQAPAGPGSAVTFNAQFETFPGTQTDLYSILAGYHDPSYTYDQASLGGSLDQIEDWPTFTSGQAAAYNIFSTMAQAGARAEANSGGAAPQSAPLANFTDFRDVGSESAPATQSGYLGAVWAPISAIIQDVSTGLHPSVVAGSSAYGVPSVVVNGVYYVYGFTAREFQNEVVNPIADGGGTGSPSGSDFLSVQSLIDSANADRTRLQKFVNDYQLWTTTQSGFLGDAAEGVAQNLSAGIVDASGTLPVMQAAVDKLDEATNALNIIAGGLSTIASAAAFVVTDGSSALAKGVVKATSLASSAAWLGSSLTQKFDSDSNAEEAAKVLQSGVDDLDDSRMTSEEILQAGDQLDTANREAFLDSYLDMQVLESTMFSNYGLLQALSGIAFPTDDKADLTPSDIDTLNQTANQIETQATRSYQLAAYQSLLPDYFDWQNMTDKTTQTTLGTNLANLIPLTATTTNGGSWTYNYDQGLWYGLAVKPESGDPIRISGDSADPTSAIRSMLAQFQGGSTTLAAGSGGPNWIDQATSLQDGHASTKDWQAPVPFAGSDAILTPDTYAGQTLGRFYAAVPVDFQVSGTINTTGDAIHQSFSTTGSGYDAMEWGLVNYATGQAMSTTAAEQLFGTPDAPGATLAQPPGTNQYYLDYATPPAALANIADAFYKQAGWSVPGGGNAATYQGTSVNGFDANLPLGPSTATISDDQYLVTPTAGSALKQGYVSGSHDLGTSIQAPASGSMTIPGGSYITSPSGRFYLAFQTDGNLVLYDAWDANQPIWASGTDDAGGNTFSFGSDGVLEVQKNGTSLWNSSLALPGINGGSLAVSDEGAALISSPNAYSYVLWTSEPSTQGAIQSDAPQANWLNFATSPAPGATLQANQTLSSGQYLLSPDGEFALVLQANGRLVEYDLDSRTLEPIITLSSSDQPGQAIMTAGGDFELRNYDGSNLFQAGKGVSGSYLRIQDDGNIVVYEPNGKVDWASNTLQAGKSIRPDGDSGTTLPYGQALNAGQYITSPNGQYALVMQDNGDLDLYDLGAWSPFPLWSSGTSPDTSQSSSPPDFVEVGGSGVTIFASIGNTTIRQLYAVASGSTLPSTASLSVADDGAIELKDGSGDVDWEPYSGSSD